MKTALWKYCIAVSITAASATPSNATFIPHSAAAVVVVDMPGAPVPKIGWSQGGVFPPFATWSLNSLAPFHSASQNASITSTGVSLDGTVLVEGSLLFDPPWVFPASANSSFDFAFSIDTPMSFTLMARVDGWDYWDRVFMSFPDFSFHSLNGGMSISTSDMRVDLGQSIHDMSWTYNGTGVLPPGDYHLAYNMGVTPSFGGLPASLQLESFSLNLSLAPASVPETGSALWLLTIACGVLGGIRRFCVR